MKTFIQTFTGSIVSGLWNGGCFVECLGAKFLYLSSVHIKDLSSDNFNLTLNLIPATHYNIAI